MDEKDYTVVPRHIWRLRLSGSELRVLMHLYNSAQYNLKTSRKGLSKRTGYSLSSVNKAIGKLISRGYITKETHKDVDGNNLPSTYTTNDDVILAACEENAHLDYPTPLTSAQLEADNA